MACAKRFQEKISFLGKAGLQVINLLSVESVPTKSLMELRVSNLQRKRGCLKKKKFTNKELTQAVMGFSKDVTTNDKNIRFLAEKVFLIESLLNLLLEHDKEFNKIVMKKAKEVEKTRSSDKKGT